MHESIPGLAKGRSSFYSLEAPSGSARSFADSTGGRILVGVGGIPYKCPPAPVEFMFMLEEYLRKRGIRDRSEVELLLSPLNRAFTIESARRS